MVYPVIIITLSSIVNGIIIIIVIPDRFSLIEI